MSSTSLEGLNGQIQQLEAQLVQLQAEAEKQRKEAIGSEVQQLIEKIAMYGITAKELGLTGKSGASSQGSKPQSPSVANGVKT